MLSHSIEEENETMTQQAIQQEALSRAVGGLTMSNYPSIYQGFMAKGIPEGEIKPRENIFTFHAWKALGRQVRKGEHGVKIATFREVTKTERNQETGEEEKKSFRSPWFTTVFHVSQTDAITGKAV